MKPAFRWLLGRFLVAFAVLVAVQIAIDIAGIRFLLYRYRIDEERRLSSLAFALLEDPALYDSKTFPYSSPFFVYDADENLVWTNRGKGRQILAGELRAVRRGAEIAGYYYAEEINFADTHSNRVFLSSVILLAAVSILASLILGFFFALRSSRSIARPVEKIRSDIAAVAHGGEVAPRAFEIAEYSDISAELARVSGLLRSSEEYKRRWMRDLAHDLRTPISGLKSQMEAMRDGVLAFSPERIDRNLREVSRLEALVASMSALTAIEERTDVCRETIDSQSFISDIVSSFEIAAREKELSIEREIALPEFTGDRNLLLRAVGNIASNAVLYSDSGCVVRLGVKPATGGKGCEIFVENDGPSIPEDQLGKVFDRLFRGEFARNTGGSGLGLSITREIARLHGGDVKAENLEPRGVRFTVMLA